jgi:hypothetical protein
MSAVPPPPGRSAVSGLARAALFGLCAGLLSGGILLLAFGLRGLFGRQDCAGLSEQECELMLDAASHVGRVQTLCGGALMALGLCVIVLTRPYLSPPPPPTRP